MTNKKLIEKVPAKGAKLTINEWTLELDDGCELDKEKHTLKGTGWIRWSPGTYSTRVAVKFDSLRVNTDLQVFSGRCVTYPEDKSKADPNDYTAEQALDSLFSGWGLDNIWGDLSLPSDIKNKVSSTVGGELTDLAESYDLGKYYSYFKKGENQWEKWKKGDLYDFYCPTALPESLASMLPDDFSLQIANMMFSPTGAVMDLIGEFALPKSDILDNDVLIFGMPRMCIEHDRFLPEDGVLALLSNFKIKDPGSSWTMTFKAPAEPMKPQDGCFVSWENDELKGLSVDIAMTIPGMKRAVEGKVTDEPVILNLTATIMDEWSDWIGTIQMDPFELEDLSGWIFTPGKNIIFDHSYDQNHRTFPDIAALPRTYDPAQVSTDAKNNWKAWQGVYVEEISVQFPKWAVFGNDGDQGLKIAGQKMLFDNSGVTCDIAALNLFSAKTAKAGGWEFDLDQAKVMITQNNYDSCHIEGRFAIPLFGEKNDKDPNAGKVRFACDIRHLTDGETVYYTYDKDGKKQEHKKKTYGEKPRMAYLFKTQQIDSLNFKSFLADIKPIKDQTYLWVAAEDKTDGTTDTYVELCMGGQINIADTSSTVNSIRDAAKKLKNNMDFKGIHFAKLRLANFAYADTARVYKQIGAISNDSLGIKRVRSEKEWEKEHEGRWVAFENKELKLTDKCFLDLGEWSLSSPKKKIGPFAVELKKFTPDFEKSKNRLSLGIEGAIGFCEDKVTAAVGIDILSTLTIPKDYKDISGYSLEYDSVAFRSVELKADLGMLTLEGRLEAVDDKSHGKGYGGKLNLDVKELFQLDINGGYYKKDADADDKKAMGKEPEDSYAWGYFTADLQMDAKTSPLRFDPLVITHIAGGIYFNALPTYDSQTKKFKDPVGKWGMVGLSFGLGLSASSGEETLNGDMALNMIYDRANHRMTTFALKGEVKAVSGIIKADMQMLYQNDDQDRFLSLDITAEGGFDNKLGDKIEQLNSHLIDEKEQLDAFQANLDEKVKNFKSNPMSSLAALNSDYDKTTTKEDEKKNEEEKSAETEKEEMVADKEDGDKEESVTEEDNNQKIINHKLTDDEKKKAKAGEFKVSLSFLAQWKKNGVQDPKWHMYLGEPDKDKRCKIVLIDFKSAVVSVDIGADAYICMGNELPNNGQLPPIPSEITEFLNGGSSSTVNTNADLQKAEQSRLQAVRAMLGTADGGVMVGASAWGYINLDLGLFYGYLKTIAGFDMSIVHYGDNAYCANIRKKMGKDGWYAQGQFYAYLAAKFGLHIKLGSFIDKKIDILDAGIGGVFDAGLPSPTWIEGRARVKIKLLDGLVKINKKFEFECGDRCVPFKGNALDDFNLFDEFSLGSSSYEQAWADGNGYTVSDAISRAQFTTTAALNSQYRLVDPTTLADLAQTTNQKDSLLEIHAARTYVFNLDEDQNGAYGIKGVRLFKIPVDANAKDPRKAAEDWLKKRRTPAGYMYFVNSILPSSDESLEMKTKEIGSPALNNQKDWVTTEFLDNEYNFKNYEVEVGVREKQGMKYHLQDMKLDPDAFYMLVLTGTAFEVNNGKKQWCDITVKGTDGYRATYQKWIQHKFYFFRTKGKTELADSLRDLSPYVALAYPAGEDGKLFNDEYDNAQAYIQDLANPTIALREDIRGTEFTNRGNLVWRLQSRTRGQKTFSKTETRENVFQTGKGSTRCVNMEPITPFEPDTQTGTTSNPMVYNLQLVYQMPSRSNIFNWMLEHSFTDPVSGMNKKYSSVWMNESDVYKQSSDNKDSVAHAIDMLQFLKNHQVDVDQIPNNTSERVLADMWFRKANRDSWQGMLPNDDKNALSGDVGYTDPLPYEQPFIGVRPYQAPELDLATRKTYTADPYTSYTGYKDEKMDEFRMKDPYFFFSYLSNWVFIGGRQIKKYDFDGVPTPHASETLTFSYNGMDIAASSQVNGMNRQNDMELLRDSMYNVWGNWYFSDTNQPKYPLPTRLGTNYDRTMANQDGKVSVWYTPWNKADANQQKIYGLKDYLQNFTAPYYVAEALNDKLYEIFGELYTIYQNYLVNSTGNNDKFKTAMQQWSDTHRGQYLTVESQGYEVRVPYYQFPLIFSNMFGDNAYDPVYKKSQLSQGRTFNTSLNGSSGVKKAMWMSYVQNLFFWRIRGGQVWKQHDDFKSLYSQTLKNEAWGVSRERFNAETALGYVKKLTAGIYRVDSYDPATGQFTVGYRGAAAKAQASFGYNTVDINDSKVAANTKMLGTPDVLVNGKVYKAGTATGSAEYADLTIAPEMPPSDEESSTSKFDATKAKDNPQGESSTTSANNVVYVLFLNKVKTDMDAAVAYYNTINQQNSTLATYIVTRLQNDQSSLYRAFMAALNGSDMEKLSSGQVSLGSTKKKKKN